MTKFQIMSDVHQEFSKVALIEREKITGDVLLLAGDITSGPFRIEYLKSSAFKDLPIFYVPGNHEYYGAQFTWAKNHYKEFFKDTNVRFMDRETVIHNGVRIIVATLWTDFLAPMKRYIPAGAEGDDTFLEDQQINCKAGMADFTVIKGFSTHVALDEHKAALGYIKEVLSKKHDGPTIVMTHHAPSFKSSHPKYDSSYIKAGFCSNLDYVIEEYKPNLWVHGHTHDSFDYSIGATRVVCNPRGYGMENRHGFLEQLIVEL